MAKEVFDLMLDQDFDLQIRNGDFVLGESTQQHQDLLLISHKGSFRQSPLVGVGISNFILDESSEALKREIQKQYELDGLQIQQIQVKSLEEFEISAFYK